MLQWAPSAPQRSWAFSLELDKRDHKPEYLRHLPRIERYLARNLAHPLLQPLAVWYRNHLPRALGPPPVNTDPEY